MCGLRKPSRQALQPVRDHELARQSAGKPAESERVTLKARRNIAKHAGESAVRVQLRAVRAELSKIRDQGSGVELGEARGRDALGILNVKQRARLGGGSFTLKAQPGKVKVALSSAGSASTSSGVVSRA